LDRHGKIFQTEEEAYGRKTKYLLKHPEKLIFVDEVGKNILQKGDDNARGQQLAVTTDMISQVRNSFKDNNFMVLGFTAADGCPVMCAIIIAPSKLHVTDVTWFNPLSMDGEDITYANMVGLAK
jgi:hypothetical protein